VKTRLAAPARQQATTIHRWWRKNRPASQDLFARERWRLVCASSNDAPYGSAMTSKPDVSLVITVPGWVDEVIASSGPLETDEQRMGLAIALSRYNIERGGGPFGALVFAGARLVGAGVNRVVDSGFSIAHAEIVALMRAQSLWNGSSIGGGHSLVTTTEPCCQCFGALIWSGIDHLVCGATTEDAEAIGFDEGPKPDAWVGALENRRIRVTQRVRRDEARTVLTDYLERGGTIYGMRRPAEL
jgi:tRNA(Arg) A34 adenosine deaminase TadA